MIKDLGEEILINCSHSNTNFEIIQWYKQSAGKSDMALVGYVRYSSPAVEDKFKETHNVSGDGRSLSSLHIPKLSRSEDRAVYFCAASEAQCCTNPLSLTKTFSDETSYTITIIHLLITQSRDTLNDSHQPAGSSWDPGFDVITITSMGVPCISTDLNVCFLTLFGKTMQHLNHTYLVLTTTNNVFVLLMTWYIWTHNIVKYKSWSHIKI